MTRKRSDSYSEKSQHIVKKPKLFSGKEFRKQLKQGSCLNAISEFSHAVNGTQGNEYILEFLEGGGSCLELIQTLELDSTLSPTIVFKLVTQVLLKIETIFSKFQNSAFEACRYILNNYTTILNKMIHLSSTTPERKACLKLLTVIVTLSSTFAKDILLHIKFNSEDLELLTKPTGEKDSVRDHFIRFLTAYLVDGQHPALSMLLEKNVFIKSIVSGLKFDYADTLCLVISAMKKYILENPFISKTVKMKTFSTPIVVNIVDVYNWEGPQAVKAQKNNKSAVKVDEVEKSEVTECVHDFLLILCTSHKYGVIFKDYSLGMEKKNQNALMYTVLESLKRPWEHSFKSELVRKICGACPDLVKRMWENLKPFLEPRMSPKWLDALKFSKNLIQELKPICIEFCVERLNIMQLFQIVMWLVAPPTIIKMVVPENNNFESSSVKQNVFLLVLEMLKSLENYMEYSKKWLNTEDYNKFTFHFANYISKNFPDGVYLLKDWELLENSLEQLQLLEVVFDIFSCYKNLAPALLDTLRTEKIEISNLLRKMDKTENDAGCSSSLLLVKIIDTFVDLDSSKFSTDSKLFSIVVPNLLDYYYQNTESEALTVLNKLFQNTGIFDGCSYEINIWINSISNLKKFDEDVANSIVAILKITSQNISKYSEDLSTLQSHNSRERDYSDIIQNLSNVNNSINTKKVLIRHRYLSPMVLGFEEYFSRTEITKSLKVYSNFVLLNLLHMQTYIEPVVNIINRNNFSSSSLKEYASCWIDCSEIVSLKKLKGKFDIFERFSEAALFGEIVDDFLETIVTNEYPNLLMNLLNACIFYFCNLSNNNSMTEKIFENSKKFVEYVIKKETINEVFLESLLGHPVIMFNMDFLSLDDETSENFVTKFIVSVFQYLLDVGCTLAGYLEVYREKLLTSVLKIFKKPYKYTYISSNFKKVLQLLGLDYQDCCAIFCNFPSTFEKYQDCHAVFDILTYSLKKTIMYCEKTSDLKPLSEDIIKNLTTYFVSITSSQKTDFSEMSLALLNYFKIFPHSLRNINEQLFEGILQMKDFNKDNVAFATFLLERDNKNLTYVINNKDSICGKKGLLLSFLKVLIMRNIDDKELEDIYEKFEPFLTKALQKPQKAGQHFHQNYEGLIILIKKCMPIEKCKNIWGKVKTYQVSEIFHAKLLGAICNKALSDSIDAKSINSIIMTYIHLQLDLFKRNLDNDEDVSKVEIISSIFNDILNNLEVIVVDKDIKSTSKNETVKLYCKYCLKYGVAGQSILLKTLTSLLNVIGSYLEKEDGKLIRDLLLDHSEFQRAVLGEHSEVKYEIWSLFLVLCQKWDTLMEKEHIPVLLSSYQATIQPCDRTILKLLKMYESKPEQTEFYNFNPLLWGRVAENHYSVRHKVEHSLRRQPKMGTVLDILQEDYVLSTIMNYPLEEHMHGDDTDAPKEVNEKCYDLMFLLPLFSQLLTPEQQVQTYKFTRSGALSLTVIGLSSHDEEVRKAACHVLARFYHHVDARQSGKDNLLWIRYVEAVCKGTAMVPNFKLNNFAAIYLSRMALLLTQPYHVMYLPLSQHLTAKSALDFSTVPELYTFLHSSDVNYKDHRHFILELLRDGLRTEKDLIDFMKSMALKLFSELFSSSASDSETKLIILDVMRTICTIPLGVKILCEGHSFLTQIYNTVCLISEYTSQDVSHIFVGKVIDILLSIVRVLEDKHTNLMVFNVLKIILGDKSFKSWIKECERVYFQIIHIIETRFPEFISEKYVEDLMDKANDSYSRYLFDYGCDFVNIDEDLDSNSTFFYLRQIVLDLKRKTSKKNSELNK